MTTSNDEVANAIFGDVTAQLTPSGVATVEIHRPPHNFFDVALVESLANAYEYLSATTACRVLVLCSEGKNFCAGADFSGTTRRSGGAGALQTENLYREAARLFRSPLPVVAAVQGSAIGGGLGLACSADFRVASADSRFAANFARIGIHQGFALSLTLAPLVGQQRANELFYTGRRVAGTEAHQIGLCDRLVDSSELRDAAHSLAGEIAMSAPLAVRSIRATMRHGVLEQLDAALQHESDEQDLLRATSDFVEGVRATSERRDPRFEGR